MIPMPSTIALFLILPIAAALVVGFLARKPWQAAGAMVLGLAYLYTSGLLPPDLFRALVPVFTGAFISGLMVMLLVLIRPESTTTLRLIVAAASALGAHLVYLIVAMATA